jgi:hypothetical protein
MIREDVTKLTQLPPSCPSMGPWKPQGAELLRLFSPLALQSTHQTCEKLVVAEQPPY